MPPKRPKTPVKRVCATEGCSTILSRFNPGKHCAACDDPRDTIRPSLHATRKH